MRVNSIRLAVLAAASLTAAGVAQAGSTGADFSKLGAQQQARVAKSEAAQRANSAEYNYDIKPALLKKVTVGGKVDASRKFAQAVVTLTAADNLSGVAEISVTLMGPSGQTASNTWYNSFPSKRAELDLAISMDGVSDNGTWRVYSVNVRDANNYGTFYDEAAIAAMSSRSTFTVVGATGDQSAPEFKTGGINLTPTVSRSTPPGGMLPGTPARAGVQLKLADVGTAGIYTASVEYCLNDQYWNCFTLQGYVSARGKTEVDLTLGGQIYSGLDVGAYVPTTLNISDYAGNSRYYAIYYGDDLSSMLDTPAINVTP
ncbi:hypothetical protein [Ideonella sp.]|uniref:hypothetical protein n=1 Tax=Ideonella sp. TaxID=1929293 RepID=UPI0035B40D31